ncbi:UNVERIFIED_CONTAM: hypothetical protein Sangu_2896100 [Sesamum angustifolium]|uniref:Uncharacterized protein n=1 Tax=Sesamum angustifolium TaxID=2727405 RepID=A0AAW2IP42_9LAMI
MREFDQCLIEASVDTLPMQGHWFSWHNSSEGARNLWKRLDPALVNEAWLERLIYTKAIAQEQSMLKQRAKLTWLKEGDVCSKAFFRKAKGKIAIHREGIEGRDISLSYLSPRANHLILEEEAARLIAPILDDEIRLVVFGIADEKSPGPDGYSDKFCKGSWSVIGVKVLAAMTEFVGNVGLLKQINYTVSSSSKSAHAL